MAKSKYESKYVIDSLQEYLSQLKLVEYLAVNFNGNSENIILLNDAIEKLHAIKLQINYRSCGLDAEIN